MKDIENIKDVNKITLSYMLLKGLFGEKIEKDNPFFTYIVDNAGFIISSSFVDFLY
jgi:hypothetical protein